MSIQPVILFEEVLTPCLTFRDGKENLKQSYEDFCESRISNPSKWVVVLFYLLIFPIDLYCHWDRSKDKVIVNLAVLLYVILVGLSYFVLLPKEKQLTTQWHKMCESILVFGICVEGGLFLICGRSADSRLYLDLFSPTAHQIVLVRYSPVLLSLVFHNTEWFLTFGCWLNGTIVTLYLNEISFTITACWSCFMYLALSLGIAYEYRRQSLAKFLLAQNLNLVIKENTRLAEETHATEMRHMIANVAHDLKTPLAGFMNGNEIVANVLAECSEKYRNGSLTVDYAYESFIALHGCVNNMKSINNFMLMTINRCIDYTKASQGMKLIPHWETIDLQETLALPLAVMRDMQSKIVIVMRQISVDICTHIITDKQWLQENLLCLLSNAMKYSSGGEVHVTLELISTTELKKDRKVQGATLYVRTTSFDAAEFAAEQRLSKKVDCDANEQMLLLIEIEDSGIGLSEEMMATLFNPFRQAQRLTGGTGLGLYSLAKRVDALGGYYGVLKRRDLGQGSRFWFAIPYRPDEDSSADNRLDAMLLSSPHDTHDNSPMPPSILSTSRTANASPASTRTSGGIACLTSDIDEKLSILIVDDSVSILKLTAMMLRRQGHIVMTAENGAIAVAMVTKARLAATPYDVVVMDLQMPVMDGLEATSRIRQLESAVVDDIKPHQLIIGVSANSDHETMIDALAAGADAFMNKPFTTKCFSETFLKFRPLSITSSATESPAEHGHDNKSAYLVGKPLCGTQCSSSSNAARAFDVLTVNNNPSHVDLTTCSKSIAMVAPVFRPDEQRDVMECRSGGIRRCKTRRFAVMEVVVTRNEDLGVVGENL